MHNDIPAVTIQSNKIVSNEVKGNERHLEPAYSRRGGGGNE